MWEIDYDKAASVWVAVADSKVRPYTKIRSCLDFEV